MVCLAMGHYSQQMSIPFIRRINFKEPHGKTNLGLTTIVAFFKHTCPFFIPYMYRTV